MPVYGLFVKLGQSRWHKDFYWKISKYPQVTVIRLICAGKESMFSGGFHPYWMKYRGPWSRHTRQVISFKPILQIWELMNLSAALTFMQGIMCQMSETQDNPNWRGDATRLCSINCGQVIINTMLIGRNQLLFSAVSKWSPFAQAPLNSFSLLFVFCN